MNLKIADFGFATDTNIRRLALFRGTRSYMAPEIWDTVFYDGRQADVFSSAVIIFIIVCGKRPFNKATK